MKYCIVKILTNILHNGRTCTCQLWNNVSQQKFFHPNAVTDHGSTSPYPCWFTPELRHISKCMRTLKKRLSKHLTPPLQSKLTNLKSEYSNKILHAKSMYESQLVQSFAGPHNAKIFDYVRSLSRKSSIPVTVFLNDLSATSDIEKAELFNNFFHSVFTKSPSILPNMDSIPLPPSCLCSISFSDSDTVLTRSHKIKWL